MISDEHLAMLAASGITVEHAMVRGYETITDKRWFDTQKLKVTPPGRNVPGLYVPMLRSDGSQWGYQYRPDNPRLRGGKLVKYETPTGQRNGLDFPPGVSEMLADPAIPLWITEGVKKADCAALHGLCCVGLVGVWNFMYTNSAGGKMALPEFRDIALNGRRVVIAFDGDMTRNEQVQKAAHALATYLTTKGAHVEFLWLPDTDDKTGLDDYLVAGHTVEDLWKLVKPHQPRVRERPEEPPPTPEPPREPVAAITLAQAHTVFRRWLGEDYDTDALDVCLIATAVERLDGDPLWVLIVSGPGNAKTETVQPFHGVGGIVISSISGEAALLSATPARDRAKTATGGLLCRLGNRGLLIVKDFTSILSMDHLSRDRVLAALREVYDGNWAREVGAEGGRLIPWTGRIAVIGAVTTAWDTHHAVIAKMGDRFTLLRMDSRDKDTRRASGLRAMFNTGGEVAMRQELSDTVAGVLAGMNTEPIRLTETEMDIVVAAADLTTLARTGVECDYRGEVIDAHDPEMPTRFAKQLGQVVRGGVALGMDRVDAMKLAIRCARDSIPPLRMAIVDDLAKCPGSTTTEVRRRVDKPRNTVGRQLEALHMLGVVTLKEVPYEKDGKVAGTQWHYSLAADIDPTTLDPETCPEKLVGGCEGEGGERGEGENEGQDDSRVEDGHTPTHFSGHASATDGENPHQPGHAAYVRGLCKTCHVVPYRPGGTQCEDCFQADEDALKLVVAHLRATLVDPEESAS